MTEFDDLKRMDSEDFDRIAKGVPPDSLHGFFEAKRINQSDWEEMSRLVNESSFIGQSADGSGFSPGIYTERHKRHWTERVYQTGSLNYDTFQSAFDKMHDCMNEPFVEPETVWVRPKGAPSFHETVDRFNKSRENLATVLEKAPNECPVCRRYVKGESDHPGNCPGDLELKISRGEFIPAGDQIIDGVMRDKEYRVIHLPEKILD